MRALTLRSKSRLTAARAAAEKLVGRTAARTASPSLVLAIYSHTEAEQQAALAYLRGQERLADVWTKDGPVWLGWAIYEAFMAGVDCGRKEE